VALAAQGQVSGAANRQGRIVSGWCVYAERLRSQLADPGRIAFCLVGATSRLPKLVGIGTALTSPQAAPDKGSELS
jgi:hypothetical protein